MSDIPKLSGEYAVGTFTYSIMNDREEVMYPGTMRSVAARVYYPVHKDSVVGLEKVQHMSRNITKGIKMGFKIPLNYDKMEASGTNYLECYKDAPRIEGEKFPLIMFHHGLGSYREGNAFLCLELASHGYVVISVVHPLEAACTEFDDGSFVFYDKTIMKKMYDPFLGATVALLKLPKFKGTDAERAEKFDEMQNKYCRFLMNRLPEWVKDNDVAYKYARENLADLIDFEKGVGIAGHSMGGDVAYKVCATKPDYVCGINIDGALFGDYSKDIQEKPFMQISCKANENVVNRVYIKHKKPVYKALFRDMNHMGFSDMKHAMKPSGLTTGKLDPDEMHSNLCKCFLEMFDTYLKGKKSEPDLQSNSVITVKKYNPDI